MEIVAGHGDGDFRYVELTKEASRSFLVLLKVLLLTMTQLAFCSGRYNTVVDLIEER